VGQAFKEAETSSREHATGKAMEKISKGIAIIEHRQKLIKIADNSELEWRIVAEYETSNLAHDSEDEKKC